MVINTGMGKIACIIVVRCKRRERVSFWSVLDIYPSPCTARRTYPGLFCLRFFVPVDGCTAFCPDR